VTRALALAVALALASCSGGHRDAATTKVDDALPAPSPPPPTAAPGAEAAVFRPLFHTSLGELEAGTAFVCRIDTESPVLLLTAHHLFGTAGGLDRDYAWNELSGLVSTVSATSLTDTSVVSAGAPLVIEGAAGMEPPLMGTDVAAFPLTGTTRVDPLPLAARPTPPGTRVWLVAEVLGGPPDQLRHGATVTEIGDEYVVYAFDDASIQLRATSGAPVINEAGEVVAINLGGGADGGRMYGVGNPSGAVRKRIRAALQR